MEFKTLKEIMSELKKGKEWSTWDIKEVSDYYLIRGDSTLADMHVDIKVNSKKNAFTYSIYAGKELVEKETVKQYDENSTADWLSREIDGPIVMYLAGATDTMISSPQKGKVEAKRILGLFEKHKYK